MQQQSPLLLNFLQQQRDQENSKDSKAGGWNPQKQLWFPHASLEGGTKTIGYGTKLTAADGNKYDAGITDQMAIQLQLQQFQKNEKFLQGVLGQKFNLSDAAARMVANDLIYNVGEGGFLKFKKFIQALGDNDKQAIILESKTFYTDASGKRCEMQRRNKFRESFINQFWGK